MTVRSDGLILGTKEMSTENEKWRDASSEQENAGNQFDRERNYNRSSYNREDNERSYRPRYNSENGDRPQRTYNNDRPYRPRYNSEGGDRPQQRGYNSDRPYRPRYNSEGGDRPQRSSYGNNSDRPYRPRYNNEGNERPYYNNESGERPQRSYGNDRPYRPRYNSEGGDRPQRSYNSGEHAFRPKYNRGESGDRPQRPYYNNNNNGERPFRPRFNDGGEGRSGFARPQRRTADYDPNAKYSKKKQIAYKEQFVDPNEPIRLNKYLANAGVCSRREADEFIAAGVVSVNGEVVTELGTKIKRGDEVKFHDQAVSIERKIYVLLNKPKDCVTTSDDPQARRTVMDLVKGACEERIYPVGRLDRNTTGVLLLTNDGDLASKLTHPKFLKKKVYQVHTDKNVTKADMEQIAAGIELEDGLIQADAISYIDEAKRNEVGIEIHSGKNRIVRRIFESLGYKVVRLDRVLFAGLTKKGLRRGEWRFLSQTEVNFLQMGSFE